MMITKLNLFLPLQTLREVVFLKNKRISGIVRCITNYSFRNENLTQDFFENLGLAIGKEKLTTSFEVCSQYGKDEGYHKSSPADIVTYPSCVTDICKIVKLCSTYRVPVIPHGTGTGLEHGVGAIVGGISIDLAILNSVIELNIEDFDCTVEAGITRKTLNSHLKHTGLMFPIQELMHQLEVW